MIHYINSIFNKNKKIYIDLIIIFIFFVLAKMYLKRNINCMMYVDISKFLIYFPSFIFGMLIRKYSNIAEFLFKLKNLSWYYIIFAIFFSFKYFDFKFDETILISIIQKIRNYILPISGSLAVIVYLKNRVNSIKLLEQLGVKSLSIYISLNPQLHSRSATYIKRNGLLIRKITIKSSRPFQCAYHPLTP